MTRKALAVTQDLAINEVDLDAPEGSLKVLQTAVGGWIEPVRLPGQDFDMYCNEEFLYTEGLYQNLVASAFARQPIMGNVIFTGPVDDEGDSTGLTAEQEVKVRVVVDRAQLFMLLGEG